MTDGRAPRARTRAGADEVPRITTAAEPLTQDMSRRTRRYLIQMTIRVVCFLGAVSIDHWTRWVLLLGAVVLPYVAVLLANLGADRSDAPTTFIEPPSLPAGPTTGRP